MNPEGPDEWSRWRREVFGDPYLVWHDGPTFTALFEAARSDPATVGRMLTQGIELSDPLAAESLAALADADLAPDGAEALLRDAARSATGVFLVRVAQALHTLTREESWAGPVASVLAAPGFWSARIDAAIALADFTPTANLVRALAHAVTDDEYLVRYHAANTLLRYSGVETDVSDVPGIFARIASGTDRTAWHTASEELAAAAGRGLR